MWTVASNASMRGAAGFGTGSVDAAQAAAAWQFAPTGTTRAREDGHTLSIETPGPVVLFDLDGTLVDTAADLGRALNKLLDGIGLQPVAPAAIRNLIGKGGRRLIVEGLKAGGRAADETELDGYVARFLEFYRQDIASESRPFPGAEAALEDLRQAGAQMAIATNKYTDMSELLLKELGLSDYFAFIAGADTWPVRKPDPGHLTLTVERLGGAAGGVVMVGDSEPDVAAARAAKIPVIGVPFGYTEVPMHELRPDLTIGHFDELVPAIERLLGRRLRAGG